MPRNFLNKKEVDLVLTDPARAAFNWRRRAEMLDATAQLVSGVAARDGLLKQAERWREKAARAEAFRQRLSARAKTIQKAK